VPRLDALLCIVAEQLLILDWIGLGWVGSRHE
jgi:hypothetical protein